MSPEPDYQIVFFFCVCVFCSFSVPVLTESEYLYVTYVVQHCDNTVSAPFPPIPCSLVCSHYFLAVM